MLSKEGLDYLLWFTTQLRTFMRWSESLMQRFPLNGHPIFVGISTRYLAPKTRSLSEQAVSAHSPSRALLSVALWCVAPLRER